MKGEKLSPQIIEQKKLIEHSHAVITHRVDSFQVMEDEQIRVEQKQPEEASPYVVNAVKVDDNI